MLAGSKVEAEITEKYPELSGEETKGKETKVCCTEGGSRSELASVAHFLYDICSILLKCFVNK